ncbi:MAG: Flp pilus assembly complex ATPase component TadA [Candidatus Riflebacteria bacterium]|nr:Flp pilus assembly complex ATPase component TadA [Candidatus Riflebacteria bacterium]
MKRLGQILISNGTITAEQLEKGLLVSAKQKIRLGEALIDLGFLDEETLADILSKQFSIPRISTPEIVIDPTVLHEVTLALAQKHSLVPVKNQNGALVIATADPLNTAIISDLENRLKKRISIILATRSQINRAITQYYSGREDLNTSLRLVETYEFESLLDNLEQDDSLLQSGPIVKFVNEMLIGAAKERASDIHIERDGYDFHIRYRIDGILKTMFRPKLSLHPLIISRVKVMAKLDVSEHRIPQDGRIMMDVDNYPIDFRVAICPCIDGENAVLRLLNNSNEAPNLAKLGFQRPNMDKLMRLLANNFGLILVAGQTGSGKTTTLYSVLNQLNKEGVKIITLEDPVEIRLPLINQIQVNNKVNLSFASGLRSILRMDPDIVLVGEIRDRETADLAINAAMTGHLVFSTVHCGNSSEVPIRLGEMGIEPYLTANVLRGALSQRLVRVNCNHCLEKEKVSDHLRNLLNIDFDTYIGKGCAACGGIGYRGRTCIEEVLMMNEEIRKLVVEGGTASDLEKLAKNQGMISIYDSGIIKLKEKTTSAAELARVL